MIDNAIETGINELSHPNPYVRARLVEFEISDCPSGCKYYRDPKSDIVVLHHNGTYGCRRTKAVLKREREGGYFPADDFAALEADGRKFWMVSLKDRLSDEELAVMAIRSGAFERMAEGTSKINKGMSSMTDAIHKAAKSISAFGKAFNKETN